VITKQNFDNIELMEAIQASFNVSDLEDPMGERRKNALITIVIQCCVLHNEQ
jgi:hypothetical protein